MHDLTDGELYKYATSTLGFKFTRMNTGGIEMQYPFPWQFEALAAVREADREMQRRWSPFMGFVELQLIGEQP